MRTRRAAFALVGSGSQSLLLVLLVLVGACVPWSRAWADAPPAAALQLQGLTCEHLQDPAGIDVGLLGRGNLLFDAFFSLLQPVHNGTPSVLAQDA